MGIFDKAKDFASNNPDKADSAVDKAGDMLDQKTGGKYSSQVDKGQDFARGQYGGGQQGEAAPGAAPEDQAGAPGQPGQPEQQQGGFDAPGQPEQQGGFDAPQQQDQQPGFDAPQQDQGPDAPQGEGEQRQF
ncbi:hypothetical protein CGZ96_02445 [Enemella evansiae]|uniref:antitoxin n=1 Tax=Enemella evansiae TaxID=2016499 RepID=UPI000B962CA2|nr:antitoxin [Enemella evansiae]OYO02225.1 hypothetical protein CGZ96_02445 [Enemella evansiae]